MCSRDDLFNAVFITTHESQNKEIMTKVRFATSRDWLQAKMLKRPLINSNGEVFNANRVDFIDLPIPMKKIDAVRFALSHETFSSKSDQYLLREKLRALQSAEKKYLKQTPNKISAEELIRNLLINKETV